MRKIVSVLIAFVLMVVAVFPVSVAAEGYYALEEEEPPYERGLVPVRAFFEDMGGVVEWNAETYSIHIYLYGGFIILSTTGEFSSHVNDYELVMMQGVTLWEGVSYITFLDLLGIMIVFMETMDGPETATFRLTEEARELALEDFDYLINLILENTPWDSVIYRRLGVDFENLAAQYRDTIDDMIPLLFPLFPDYFPVREEDDPRSIAANYLSYLLAVSFSGHLEGIGHLGPRGLEIYRMQVSGFLRQHNFETYHNLYNPMLQLFVDTFMNPSVIWFYGEYEADLIEQYHPFPQIPDNIVTRSIVEGEIAYLRIDSFLADPEYDDLKILPFLQSIQDYDHLIIDIQGNLGGIGDYFNALVLRRLISAPVEVGGFEFFSSGDVASRWMHAYVDTSQLILEAQSPFHWNELMYITITPIDEFIAQRDMPYFNPDDLERLAYAVSTRSTIWPSFDRVGFDGKIWLLIDENSASASALAAATALYTGFATVVGENTSGVMGSTHAYASLPNTGLLWRMDIGYVTDLYGRSLEVYGISPQIKNRPNMTALETVLAIIAEAKEEAKENDTESYDVEMNNQDEPPTSPLPQ